MSPGDPASDADLPLRHITATAYMLWGGTCSEALMAGFRPFTAAQSLCLVAIWLAFADL